MCVVRLHDAVASELKLASVSSCLQALVVNPQSLQCGGCSIVLRMISCSDDH